MSEKDQFDISEDKIGSITKYFKAIAHPKRLTILNYLTLEDSCDFSRLKRLTELSKTALANHLSQLEKLALIKRVERGHYEITEDGSNLVYNTIAVYNKSQFSNKSTRYLVGKEYLKFKFTKMLSNVEFKSYWVSHLACLHGGLEYLGVNISKQWLFGITGHAFIINIRDHICPSGPTAWNNDMINVLVKNIGVDLDKFYAETSEPFSLKNGWEFVRSAIKQKYPCYGWQIGDIREFYLIYGFDNTGYYYKGYFQTEGAGPKPWKEIGKMFIKLHSVKKINSVVDNTTQVKSALKLALKHSKNPPEWINKPWYSSGIEGFDKWIKWVEDGKAEQFGQAYNSGVWAECRQEAVKFLQEARVRLNDNVGKYIDESINCYKIVAENLSKVSEIYPFDMNTLTVEPIGINENSKAAAAFLRKARDAESNGLNSLEELIKIL